MRLFGSYRIQALPTELTLRRDVRKVEVRRRPENDIASASSLVGAPLSRELRTRPSEVGTELTQDRCDGLHGDQCDERILRVSMADFVSPQCGR